MFKHLAPAKYAKGQQYPHIHNQMLARLEALTPCLPFSIKPCWEESLGCLTELSYGLLISKPKHEFGLETLM